MQRFIAGIAVVIPFLFLVSLADAQDARRGEHVFRKCLLCHVTNPNSKDLIAPPLHNVVGRKAASIPGFDYSDIMKIAGKEGLLWNAEALFYFLDRPEEFMPGTYMAFSGLDEQERKHVIAYLERIAADWKRNEARQGRPSPSPAPTKLSNPKPASATPSRSTSGSQPRQP